MCFKKKSCDVNYLTRRLYGLSGKNYKFRKISFFLEKDDKQFGKKQEKVKLKLRKWKSLLGNSKTRHLFISALFTAQCGWHRAIMSFAIRGFK